MSISNEEQLSHTPSLLRVGLIGNPVVHSYSPRFQQAAFDAFGIPARYELWQTPASELPARVASLRAANGLSMLLHQGALAFTLWTGQPAPLEIMRSTLL